MNRELEVTYDNYQQRKGLNEREALANEKDRLLTRRVPLETTHFHAKLLLVLDANTDGVLRLGL